MRTECAGKCGKKLEKAWHLLCPDCWGILPKMMQDKLWRELKAGDGSTGHQLAVNECIKYVRQNQPQPAGGEFRPDEIPNVPIIGEASATEAGG